MVLDKEIPLGSEGSMDIKIEGGALVLTVVHKHASGQVSISAKEDLKYFLEKLKAVLPAWAAFPISIAEAELP